MESFKGLSHQVPEFSIETPEHFSHICLKLNCMLIKDQFDRINVTENVGKLVQILMRRLPSLALLKKKL